MDKVCNIMEVQGKKKVINLVSCCNLENNFYQMSKNCWTDFFYLFVSCHLVDRCNRIKL